MDTQRDRSGRCSVAVLIFHDTFPSGLCIFPVNVRKVGHFSGDRTLIYFNGDRCACQICGCSCGIFCCHIFQSYAVAARLCICFCFHGDHCKITCRCRDSSFVFQCVKNLSVCFCACQRTFDAIFQCNRRCFKDICIIGNVEAYFT